MTTVLVDGPDPAVVDDRHRTVPAAVRAAPAGLDRSNQTLLAVDRQSGVAIEGGSRVAGWHAGLDPGQLDRGPGVATTGPRHQPRFVLAGDDRIGRPT